MTGTQNTAGTSPDQYLGLTAVDPQHDKIGSVGQVYVNDQSGIPDWVTVNTGLFGTTENFVPLEGSRVEGDRLVLPFGKDVVKDAPKVADASHLDPDEQEELYAHYSRYFGTGRTGYTTGGTVDADADFARTDDTVSGGTDLGGRGTVGHDTSGPTTDEAMTRSEEHLNVGTQRVEAGRARLRKYVVTEQQSVTVPVTREEVTIEREPITEANRGDALSGPAISEEEHEVVLHAERPVVETEAVPVERVRLGTETVTDQQQVTGEVRKEQIEVDDDSTSRTARDTSL
ncbi:MAG: hypothetical protein JWL64_70 [Frankiales bacterium]|nr:hypothetical protein [Frankiales bacterium]